MQAYSMVSPLYPPHPGQLGFRDYPRFIEHLAKAVNDEATAIELYKNLMGSAENKTQRAYIEHAYRDEQQHLKMFSNLYYKLTRSQAVVKPTKVAYTSYQEGIEKSIDGELGATELYRNMYLSVRLPKVRDILFRAMTDEIEHTQRFNFIYTQLRTS